MTTVQITIDDSLPLSKLKTALSLFRGVTKIEVTESYVDTEKKEYEQLKDAFLNGSKRSMAQQRKKIKIREGWDAAFAQYALDGEDEHLLPDFLDSEVDAIL